MRETANLWEHRFRLDGFYFSGVPFPFNKVGIDESLILKKAGKQIMAYIGRQSRDSPAEFREAEQDVLVLTHLYSLASSFSRK